MSTQTIPEAPIDRYEWHESAPYVWRRTCIGHEASASFNENIAYGHTELSMTCTFRIHYPASSSRNKLDDLVSRVRIAWIQARHLRPEAAVEMDTHSDPTIPQTLTYQVLREEQAIREWVDETFIVTCLGDEGAGSLDELCAYTYNRPLPTKGKQSMLYLVLPRSANEEAHLIWNVSHAVTDGGSIVEFYNVLLQCIIDAKPSSSVYNPTAFELDVFPRLPRSVVTAYQQQFKPSPQDIANASAVAESNMRLIEDKMSSSLALSPAPSWTHRKHETICLVRTMEAAEARELLRFAKSVKSGITYLASAATIMATSETFSERKGSSKGALMGMVRNARRWLKPTTPTPLGSDAVFLWIPVDTKVSLEPSFSGLQQLVEVARQIKVELDQHLVSPHCISSYPSVADGAIAGLTQQWSQISAAKSSPSTPNQAELDAIIGPQAPGFSSVGVFKIHPRFTPSSPSQHNSGTWLERIDAGHKGRQVNASPWMSMLTIDGRIKLQLGFDKKFHEPEKMEAFMERTVGWLRVCATAAASAAEVDGSVSARL